LGRLASWGLNINAVLAVVEGAGGCLEYFERRAEKRDALAHEINGLVVKGNESALT